MSQNLKKTRVQSIELQWKKILSSIFNFQFLFNTKERCLIASQIHKVQRHFWFWRNHLHPIWNPKSSSPKSIQVHIQQPKQHGCYHYWNLKKNVIKESKLKQYPTILSVNFLPQWWVKFDDELSCLFNKRFRAFYLICRK